jgi:hypothetical protein
LAHWTLIYGKQSFGYSTLGSSLTISEDIWILSLAIPEKGRKVPPNELWNYRLLLLVPVIILEWGIKGFELTLRWTWSIGNLSPLITDNLLFLFERGYVLMEDKPQQAPICKNKLKNIIF